MEPGFTVSVHDHGYVRYIDHMGTDQRIVEAARISYSSPSKGAESDKKLLGYLWRNRHTSPFEIVKITLNIKMPIFIMRQYVRHRMQNLNEVSARYTELPDEFYRPMYWRMQDDKNKQGSHVPVGDKMEWHKYNNMILDKAYETAYAAYKELINNGVAREMARIVLPVGIYTEIYTSWDLKNLLHFITLREDSHAQAEIQEYSKAIKEILLQLFPWTMEAYEKYKWEVKEVEVPA